MIHLVLVALLSMSTLSFVHASNSTDQDICDESPISGWEDCETGVFTSGRSRGSNRDPGIAIVVAYEYRSERRASRDYDELKDTSTSGLRDDGRRITVRVNRADESRVWEMDTDDGSDAFVAILRSNEYVYLAIVMEVRERDLRAILNDIARADGIPDEIGDLQLM